MFPAPSSPTSKPLTPRELEVLHYVASGVTNKAIALEMKISPATVKRTVYNAYQKLGIHSRAEATVYILNQKPPIDA